MVHKKINFYLIALLIIIIDQITKAFLTKTTNTGVAFGLFKGNITFIILISLIMIGTILYYLIKSNVLILSVGLSFFGGGAISNLLDRIFLGHVRDFIQVFINITFNIADIFSVIGASLIIIYLVKKK